MDSRFERNKRFLTDLFAGPFPGHGLIVDCKVAEKPWPGDYLTSEHPPKDWVPWVVQNFETMVEWSAALDDDCVPYVKLCTGTEFFAKAFGCKTHIYPDSPPCALPLVSTPEEADRVKYPGLNNATFETFFDFADRVRERVGFDVPVSVPDIQSPFDIAALVWRKETFFMALYDTPDAVKRLVAKCHELLKEFLLEFKRRIPNGNLCHCPTAWAPPNLGCWLSEDEVGSISTAAFEEFCLPVLTDLSNMFGGIFIHCCASAPHQYPCFNRIPNLRGMNRVVTEGTFETVINAFAGKSVLIQAWYGEQDINKMLDLARPDSRFLFNVPNQPLEEARKTYERLRARCPRR